MSDSSSQSLPTGLFQEVRAVLNTALDALESEQSKVNKAMFEAFTQQQRDAFCTALAAQKVKTSRIEVITGKSKPTVYRHLNGKNS